MSTLNLTPSSPSTFILNGIPGLEAGHIWVSIPFSTFYIISLLGNFAVLFVVGKEKTLHQPMYLLLCMLALTDISISTCVMPKTLAIFWFGLEEITLDGCLTQMFFYHTSAFMNSAILMTMAFDRYVAICNPLRYTTILTNGRIIKLGLVGWMRGVLLFLPCIVLLRRLPFCPNHVIPHTYCEHIAVVKISRGGTTLNNIYSLVVGIVIYGMDVTLIGLSYGFILRAVLRISSKKANQKALGTCTAHISVMLISYVSASFSALTHRFGQGISAHFHILLVNLYVLVPPMLNPLIYGVKTKELREKMRKYICRI